MAVLKLVPRQLWARLTAAPDELALRLSLWVWRTKERERMLPDAELELRIKKLQVKCDRHRRDRFPTR